VQPQRWVAFTVLIVIAALGACSPADRFLLYFDPYEFEVLGGQGIDRATIRQSLPKDLHVRIEVSSLVTEEAEGLRRFAQVIERHKPGWVYLSPAHPFNPEVIISQYPDVRFFREGPAREDRTGESRANWIDLVYDREQANCEAGRAIAALLRDADFLNRIGVATPGGVKPRVGILVAVSTESVRRENAAFVEGFSQLEDPQRIEIKEIGNLTDRVKARRLLDGMAEKAVAIVLLRTYVLSGFCLEYLAKGPGAAVVEGPIPDQAYGDKVLLMLVDDFIGALQQMAETIDRESPAGTVERVTAPVRLQWGEAYRSVVARFVEGVNQQ
jgi:hypothetical protein